MDHRKAPLIRHVWMCVNIARATVGGPAGVTNASARCGQRIRFKLGQEVAQLAGFLPVFDNIAGVYSDTCGVIAPVFQTFEPLEYHLECIMFAVVFRPRACISDNSAHDKKFITSHLTA